MMPLLRHVGYGMTWQQCMACVWGGLKGPLSLCLALMVLQTPTISEAGEVNTLSPHLDIYLAFLKFAFYILLRCKSKSTVFRRIMKSINEVLVRSNITWRVGKLYFPSPYYFQD